MKRILASLALATCAITSWGATLTPIQLLNPAGSTAGQVISSTGSASAPVWGGVTLGSVTGTLAVNHGGTGVSSASGTALDNITGFASTGFLKRTGSAAYSFVADPLPIANGGTGQTSSSAALTALGALPTSGGTITGVVNLTNSTASSGSTTGALVVTGGVGVGNNVFVAGSVVAGGGFTGSVAATTLSASGNDALLYSNTSGQSIPNNTATTLTTFTKVSDRVNSNFNASTGTFTAPATGVYQVGGAFTFSTATGVSGAIYTAAVVANGVTIAQGRVDQSTTISVPVQVIVPPTVVSLTAGQTIIIQVSQSTGIARTLSTVATLNFLSINRLP